MAARLNSPSLPSPCATFPSAQTNEDALPQAEGYYELRSDRDLKVVFPAVPAQLNAPRFSTVLSDSSSYPQTSLRICLNGLFPAADKNLKSIAKILLNLTQLIQSTHKKNIAYGRLSIDTIQVRQEKTTDANEQFVVSIPLGSVKNSNIETRPPAVPSPLEADAHVLSQMLGYVAQNCKVYNVCAGLNSQLEKTQMALSVNTAFSAVRRVQEIQKGLDELVQYLTEMTTEAPELADYIVV